MKKLSKLLMPIVGLSTIATTAIPLAGCNKQQSVTKYTVKFDTQGGSTIASVEVEENGTITAPTNPTKEGYDFVEWCTNKACTKPFDFSTKITSDITLYARWYDGKVDEDEWDTSLSYLCGLVDGATWKSTGDDAFINKSYKTGGELEETDTIYNIAFNDDLGTMSAIVKEPDKAAVKSEIVSIAKSNMYFSYQKQEGEADWLCFIETDSQLIQPLIIIIGAIGGYDEFKFDSKTRSYTFDGKWKYVTEDDSYSKITIKFNADKKIASMNYQTTIGDVTGEHSEINLVLHPQYENVTVDVPQELITRANDSVYKMNSATDNFDTTAATKKDGKIILDVTANGSYTTLTFTENSGVTSHPDCKNIYLDGKLLKENTDYTVEKPSSTYGKTIIKFQGSAVIKSGSKLNIYFSVPKTASELKAALA